MSIKGLTDRGLAFPEIGQIRKGIKEKVTKNGREIEIPKDLWYFRVIFDDSAKETEQVFRQIYGDEPTRIRFMLPFDELDRCWDAYLEAYTAGRMIARSDGEKVLYQVNDAGEILVLNGIGPNNQVVPHPIDNIAGHDYEGKIVQYSPVGRLRIFMPELQRAAYLLVNTTSKHDIINMTQQLLAVVSISDGKLRGVPLILSRSPKSISTPAGGGRRVRRVKHLLSIEPEPAWVAWKLAQMRRLAQPDNAGFLGAGLIDDTPENDEHSSEPEEIIETTATEVQPETIAEPVRPYDPIALRTVLAGWVTEYNQPITQRHRQLLSSVLLTCADGDAEKAQELLYNVIDAAEVGELEDNEVGALLSTWLGIHTWDDGPSAEALEEVKLLFGMSVLDPSQLDLE